MKLLLWKCRDLCFKNMSFVDLVQEGQTRISMLCNESEIDMLEKESAPTKR